MLFFSELTVVVISFIFPLIFLPLFSPARLTPFPADFSRAPSRLPLSRSHTFKSRTIDVSEFQIHHQIIYFHHQKGYHRFIIVDISSINPPRDCLDSIDHRRLTITGSRSPIDHRRIIHDHTNNRSSAFSDFSSFIERY